MAFGPNSTNPRERRAYAHALRDNALQMGGPESVEARCKALEAATAASNTKKGEGLGQATLRAFINQFEQVGRDLGIETAFRVNSPEVTRDRTLKSWSSPEFTTLHRAVQAVAGESGTTLHKPTTPEEYLGAAREIVASRERGNRASAETLAAYALDTGAHLMTEDLSVPGTEFEHDAVQALAFYRRN